MVEHAYKGGATDLNYWKHFGGKETGVENAKQLPYDHLHLIMSGKDYVELDNFIFVHAGCDNVPIENNSPETLRWRRNFQPKTPHISGKTIICGHSANKNIIDYGYFCCVDTGCGVLPKGKLTALDVLSGQIWQTNGKSVKLKVRSK